MTTVSTRRFTINTQEKIMACEMSEIGGFVRIYEDACDDGIRLVSHVTGVETRWDVHSFNKSSDGEVNFWNLRAVPEDVRKFPRLEGWTIRIWND